MARELPTGILELSHVLPDGRDMVADVLDFHRKLCPHLIGTTPAEPDPMGAFVRKELIREEIGELYNAMIDGNLPEIADGIADAIYVLIGCAITYGIDLRPVWDAIHAANLQKIGGGRREDGKIGKPDGWKHPDIKAILDTQGPLS